MIRDEATQRQVEAAIPANSTWLSANAGSGKTRVLTDRVARLLLEDVLPEHILCLTFTKAAASEMQNRLFRRLGEWAMLNDADLRSALVELGVQADITGPYLRNARTLFARAIETPGGLRIQTIHSFCSSLLRRFPLEANVSPQFKEIEDRSAELLRQEILDEMSVGPTAPLVADLAMQDTDQTLDSLVAEIVQNRGSFAVPMSLADLRKRYGVAENDSLDLLLAYVFPDGEIEFVRGLLPSLLKSGGNDAKLAEKLQNVMSPGLSALKVFESSFLTGAAAKEPFSAKIGSIPKKALQTGELAPAMDRLNDLMERVAQARERRIALSAVQRDWVLHSFASTFLTRYELEKQRRGWLDFDDLINKAHELLSDQAVAEWVLYRLDGGIDHILVDEAQDTSPVQWQVIQRLAQEFTSGEGARSDVLRTIFVVGDKKQSIYSFQGADPREFDRMSADFDARLHAAGSPLNKLSLEHSFRSAEPILRVVDNTFDGMVQAGFVADEKHRAFKENMPGRVDLWPLVEKAPTEKDDEWWEPVDRKSEQHHTVLLAKRIANFIRHSIDSQTPLPVEIGHSGTYEARPVNAGDFLILVRKRSRLYTEIIRACKQADIPIAGADRLRVMSELAVRDMAALLSFLDTPEDSYSLAVALKSPLFGVTEQQLFDLAHRRTGPFLWEALRTRKEEFPEILTVLEDLRNNIDFLRPYDLIERILIRHNGRKKLLGRLGEEAEDGINAFLAQAISYEQTAVPSLTGFLQWMETDDLEIKRQMESAGDKARVMTVHGSKGLEAPIVILPDCTAQQERLRGSLLGLDGSVAWTGSKESRPAVQQSAVEEKSALEKEESLRLLYVGMTRAEKWLVVASLDDLGRKGESWYDRVRLGMDRSGAADHQFEFGSFGGGEGKRLDNGLWDSLKMLEPEFEESHVPSLEPCLLQNAPVLPPAPEGRSPSELGGAKALPGPDGEDSEIAKERGNLIHALLENLAGTPPDDWKRIGEAVLRLRKTDITPDQMAALREEAETVLRTKALTPFFTGEALAEVPLTADLENLGPILGIIDRMILKDEEIIVVDFKSNRTVPASAAQCPEAILRQMGAYAAMLAQIYPSHRIETGILWTRTATYMPLPHDLVTSALSRAYLDVGHAAP